MKRAMAKQAEAEREKRAKIIAAEGEALAAGELARASDVMMAHPLALQLRNLQTLVEISVDKNSTVVFPAPLMSTIQEMTSLLARELQASGAALPPRALALAALVNAAALGLGALVAEPAWLTVVITLVVVPVLVLSGLRSAAGRAIGIPATLTFIAGAGLPAAPAGERFVEGLAGGAWALALFAIVIVLGLRPSPPPVPATPSGVLANHAIRLGVAAAVAVALAAALSLAHGYWLAISVAIVLRPGLEPTAERITQRLAGSLLGGVAGAVIIVQVGGSWTLIVLATLLVGGATALLLADYRIASALLTAGVLTMLDVGHGISVDAVNDRLLATAVGAGLALVALLVWPEPPDPQAASE